MMIIRTTDGERLYVAASVPQVDGGERLICYADRSEAREAREAIRMDPAMIDGVEGAVLVDSVGRGARDAARYPSGAPGMWRR